MTTPLRIPTGEMSRLHRRGRHKPHFFRHHFGSTGETVWACRYGGFFGYGRAPKDAWESWIDTCNSSEDPLHPIGKHSPS